MLLTDPVRSPKTAATGPSSAVLASVVFAITAALMMVARGNLLLMSNDEGIALDAAARLVSGQSVYKDFFLLTGPGSVWLLAALYRIFGEHLWVSRLITAMDIGLMAAAVFWFTARMATQPLAYLTTLAFASFQIFDPLGQFAANHRWDSAALATAALWCAAVATRRTLFAAGALAALAAWFTPSLLIVTIALAACLVYRRQWREYAAGIAAISAASCTYMAAQGALVPFINQMLWTSGNYAAANRFPYGAIIGGYLEFISSAHPAMLASAAEMLLIAVAPAIVILAAWKRKWRNAEEWTLAAAALAMVLSTWPRPDISHLQMISAPLYALLGAAAARTNLPRLHKFAILAFITISGLCMGNGMQAALQGKPVDTRLGAVRATDDQEKVLAAVKRHITPQHTIFVFPYQPLLYRMAGGPNPSRYSFLQPGMMPESDELSALQSLEASPPQRVFYVHVEPKTYLRLWPGSDPNRLTMPRIEEFLRTRYETIQTVNLGAGSFEIKAARSAAASQPDSR